MRSTPLRPVAVLGNGQLGSMLKEAGRRIGAEVELLSIDGDVLPNADRVVTVEREHWPVNEFTTALQAHSGWLNASAYRELIDRRSQKSLLDQLALPTAPWLSTSHEMSAVEIHDQLGDRVVLKSASGGYDGHGQARLNRERLEALPDWSDSAIAEQMIDFSTEASMLGARNRAGEMVFYRITENYHRAGQLVISLSRESELDRFQSSAEEMLGTLMDHLDYVGVMAMECFVTEEGLLVNEIAPRVHNSGHWTQEGASVSQFELHLRAVLDLPLQKPEQSGASLMLNILGMPWSIDWLMAPYSQLHWYGKEVRDRRKMGHINFWQPEAARLAVNLAQLKLPEDYRPAIQWATERLTRV